MNKLKVTAVEHRSPSQVQALPRKGTRRLEIQATMERLWHQDPEQFDPERDCMQRQRIQKTMALIKPLSLIGKQAVDIGCGAGLLTRLVRNAGMKVHAVDIASQALERLKEKEMHDIVPFQDCLPTTRLADDGYDLVICTEVLGYLNPEEYRMAFAELSRLVKADGFVVCSTALDIDSEDSLERFAALAETEFRIDQWVFSYHRLQIQLCHFFEAPGRFIKASKDADYRHAELKKRKGFGRLWFQWNAKPPVALLWKGINLLASPLVRLFRQNTSLTAFLERFCKFIWSRSGISQAIFLGQRRPLTFPLPQSQQPIEMKHKRQVWE